MLWIECGSHRRHPKPLYSTSIIAYLESGGSFLRCEKMEENHVMKTGTTTVGLVCKDGIVLAADKRATSGYLIAQKDTEKILPVTGNIAVTMAGTASDGQMLVRILRSEMKLKKIRTKRDVSVNEAANLMSRMVYNNIRRPSMIPGIAHFIMGGTDDTGFYLFDLFADGTISKVEDFISSGSGSVMAYGVLETTYKPGLSVEEGKKLAIRCVNAAVQRDIASGNGIDVFTITEKGVEKVFAEKFNTRIEA
jgi:proteasome beta subunit